MKKYIFILLLLSASLLNGCGFSSGITNLSEEERYNFEKKGNVILWQKVFNTDLTFDELVRNFKSTGYLENETVEINPSEKEFMADLKPFDPDYKGAGYSEMRAPIYIARSHFTGYLIVDYKEGKYRTTVKNFVFSQAYDDPLTEKGEKNPLRDYADMNFKHPAKILDYTLTNMLKVRKEKDNW
ncbi:MAG: hypothetical protein K9I68_00345 [Bacteroidales bacterium]|nr:hypothetical protein [Bacteroidales bacterium]MCF8336428.1 hypothetical protein [Bacteroidales bacterium]